jgi:guanylate kinase
MSDKTLCEECLEWVDLHGNHCCADKRRIEALTKERDKVWDEAVWAVAQVVDQEMARIGFIAGPDGFGRRAEMRNVIVEELKSVQSMRATLAKIEGEKR